MNVRWDWRSLSALAGVPFDATEFPYQFLCRLREQGYHDQTALHRINQPIRPAGRRAATEQRPRRHRRTWRGDANCVSACKWGPPHSVIGA